MTADMEIVVMPLPDSMTNDELVTAISEALTDMTACIVQREWVDPQSEEFDELSLSLEQHRFWHAAYVNELAKRAAAEGTR